MVSMFSLCTKKEVLRKKHKKAENRTCVKIHYTQTLFALEFFFFTLEKFDLLHMLPNTRAAFKGERQGKSFSSIFSSTFEFSVVSKVSRILTLSLVIRNGPERKAELSEFFVVSY